MLAANGCAVERLVEPARPPRHAARAGAVASSYADIIAGAGFLDREYLLERARAWDAVFDAKQPLAVVSESSPFLSVAKQGEAVPLLVTGHGFALPPPHLPFFPRLTDREPLCDQAQLLQVVADVRRARSQSLPVTLPGFLAGPRHLVTGFDALDPYRPQRVLNNCGPLELDAHYAELAPIDDLFAYLLGDRQLTLPLLASLVRCGARGRVFVRRGTAEQRALTVGSQLTWLEEPAEIAGALERARLVVHHGSMLLTEEALVAGRPQAIAPLYLEHVLTARALQELGVATVLPSRSPVELAAALRAALDNDVQFQCARSWAALHAREPQPNAERVFAETVVGRHLTDPSHAISSEQ